MHVKNVICFLSPPYNRTFYIMQDIICNNCGSINDYNIVVKSTQNTAYCNSCHKYIKNIPQEQTEHLRMYFGKYKDKLITEITDEQYLDWVLRTNTNLKDKYINAIRNRIIKIQNK